MVVSREIGCATDLVRDGVNGFTPTAGDVKGLVNAVRRLIEDETLRRRQGQASFARISQWGFEQCLQGIRSALVDLKYQRAQPKWIEPANSGLIC